MAWRRPISPDCESCNFTSLKVWLLTIPVCDPRRKTLYIIAYLELCKFVMILGWNVLIPLLLEALRGEFFVYLRGCKSMIYIVRRLWPRESADGEDSITWKG